MFHDPGARNKKPSRGVAAGPTLRICGLTRGVRAWAMARWTPEVRTVRGAKNRARTWVPAPIPGEFPPWDFGFGPSWRLPSSLVGPASRSTIISSPTRPAASDPPAPWHAKCLDYGHHEDPDLTRPGPPGPRSPSPGTAPAPSCVAGGGRRPRRDPGGRPGDAGPRAQRRAALGHATNRLLARRGDRDQFGPVAHHS